MKNMIDPTLRKGDNVIVNLLNNNEILEIHDSHDGIAEYVRKITVNTKIFHGKIVRILKCGDGIHSLELIAPSVSKSTVMFSDIKNCFIQKA